MKMKATAILCVVFLTSATTADVKPTQWTSTKSKDGINAYVGRTADNGITPTKVDMTVSVSPEKALKVITNLDNYYKWVPYCKKSYTIQRVSDTVCYGYQRISAPMVTDRDLAVRLTIRKISNKNYEVLITAVPNFVKHESNTVRIEHFIARYNVYTGADNLTHVEQETEVDIGGSIPSFLINWTNSKQPHETFQSLRNEILNS